jgi:hypothetical protein
MLTAALPTVKKESKVNNKAGKEANIPKATSDVERDAVVVMVGTLLDATI